MKILQRTHLLARGLIFRGAGEVLLAKAKGQNNTFLPGGHLERGESLADALAREVAEELGTACQVKAYLGAVEHQWPEENPTDYEVNHIFLATIDHDGPLVSKESHLTFAWCPVDQLDAMNLKPKPLRALIRRYAGGDRSVWWETTLG